MSSLVLNLTEFYMLLLVNQCYCWSISTSLLKDQAAAAQKVELIIHQSEGQ